MKISRQEFLSRTQKGIVSPVYLFSGKDEFLKESAVKKIKELTLKPGSGELNFSLFYGEESTGADIIRVASTLTLTGDKQLIVVKNTDKLRASAKTIIKKYSLSPNPSTCLVLLVIKNDYRVGDEVFFAPPSERESVTWVIRQAREKGWNISSQAAFELKEKTGVDTQALNNEIEKLTLYCEDKKNITAEDVRLLVGDSKEVIVFGITNAINKREAKKALAILKKLPGGEKKAPGVIGAIAWQTRRLASAKTKIKRGEEGAAICRAMRIPPLFQGEFISCVKALSWDKVKKDFRFILQAELDFKSGRFSPELVLELLIARLCEISEKPRNL